MGGHHRTTAYTLNIAKTPKSRHWLKEYLLISNMVPVVTGESTITFGVPIIHTKRPGNNWLGAKILFAYKCENWTGELKKA